MNQIDVPKGWLKEPLKNMCDFFVPMRDKPTEFDGTIPWMRIDEISGKYVDGSNASHRVSKKIIKDMKLRVYPIGTVLCSCSATVGVCTITKAELTTNQTFIGIFPKEKIFNEYLYYYLKSKIRDLTKLGKGTTITYISRDKFESLLIMFPDFKTQKKIVAKLDHIFSQLEEKKKQILSRIKKFDAKKINQNYKNHLLKLAFDGTLTEDWRESNSDEFTEGDLKQIFSENSQLILKNSKHLMNKNHPIPKQWLWINLSDVFDIQMGQSPPGSSYNSEEKGIPLLNGPTEFKERYPIPHKYTTKPTKICEKGDLLICVRGNTTGKINFADQKYCIGRGLAFLRPKHDSFNLDLLSYFLMKITHKIFEQTSGSTFPNLSQNKLKSIVYPLASKKEQLELVKILDQKFADWENHKQALVNIQNQHELIKKRLNNLSSSILNDAFSGKLVT